MDKDAYYFPHFSNARLDRKLRRLRKDLGIEGYGIYFMLLEVLRDQENFKYPIGDIDLLADDFGTSEPKVKTVVSNYQLFSVVEKHFFSVKFNEYLSPYLDGKQRNKINGIKGNLVRYGYLTTEQLSEMTNDEIIAFNDNKRTIVGGDSLGDRKESKVKEKKRNKSKVKIEPDSVSFNFSRELRKKGADKQLISDWIKVRKLKRAANTKTSLDLFFKQVEKTNMSINEVLTTCICKSWAGFKSDWVNKDNNQSVLSDSYMYR